MKLGGNTAGTQVTPTDQRDISYHIMSCSETKAVGKKEEVGAFRVMATVFPSNHYT